MNTQQALQQAFQHLNSGNLPMAGQLFEGVLQQEPRNFVALNGRGFIALQQNRLSQSAADFQNSIAANPKQPFAHKMLGIVQGAMGQFDASMASFDAALALDAKDSEVYFNRANFRFQAGQAQEALVDLDAAIKLRGSYLEARSNRANLLMIQQDYGRAEKDLLYLTDKVKNNPDLWVALGLSQHKLGKSKEAIISNDKALRLAPQHLDALINSSSIAFDQERFDVAATWARKALAVKLNKAEAHYALANALFELGELDGAVSAYTHAIELKLDYPEAFMGRGRAKASLRDMVGSAQDYDQAIKLKPDYDDAVFNKSYMLLEQHEFAKGWEGYDYRLKFPKFKDSLLPHLPIWQGESLEGALLVRGEQGLGDQLLFVSTLSDLLEKYPQVIVQAEKRLVPLVQRSFPSCTVLPKTDKIPEGAVAQIPLGSLPKYYRSSVADFAKAKIPYLKADSDQTAAFRQALAPNGEKIIGVNWRSFKNRFEREKSIQLSDLAPLFKLPGCVFVNLQYGDTKAEVAAAAGQGIQFSDAVQIDLTNDIDAVASLVNACDLIVSVSNSTAHIAGALGKEVLLMLPYRIGKLWYWSEAKGEGSLWYPTVTTFHQSAQGDWRNAIEEVEDELSQRINRKELTAS